MPELPEVHTTATTLNKLVAGKRIEMIWSNYRSVFHAGKNNIKDEVYFREFAEKITGKKILGVRRRAKNVLIDLESNITILVHMKMTGHLLYGKYCRVISNSQFLISKEIPEQWQQETWIPAESKESPLWDPFNRFIRLVFSLKGGMHFVLSDMRRFAKVTYFETSNPPKELTSLGPEPVHNTFSFTEFRERLLKKPMGRIKQVLMNQEVIAGIGNIYSDEMLWSAGIHPLSNVRKIPERKLRKLFLSMKEVLSKGIDFKGDSTSDYRAPSGKRGAFQYHHKAYQNTGSRCSKRGCGGIISRLKIGGRSAHFCPQHQQRY